MIPGPFRFYKSLKKPRKESAKSVTRKMDFLRLHLSFYDFFSGPSIWFYIVFIGGKRASVEDIAEPSHSGYILGANGNGYSGLSS
jgi:hypothetical protein